MQVRSKKLKCYECTDDLQGDDLQSIPPCKGFRPNSTYEIECESELADLCIAISKLGGKLTIMVKFLCKYIIETNMIFKVQ